MTKLNVSSLIKIMNEVCTESTAILEGLRKSLFIPSTEELINPDKVEFRVVEKEDYPAYIISVMWKDLKKNGESKYLHCRIPDNENEIRLCNLVGNLNCLETEEQKEFILLNKDILKKALEEANANKKYVSLNSCNMWQSTISRFYSNPHSINAFDIPQNVRYNLDINGTQIILKNNINHIWYNICDNVFSQSKSCIYIHKDKKLIAEEIHNLNDNLFSNLYIEIDKLPQFWQSIINSGLSLVLKKQN